MKQMLNVFIVLFSFMLLAACGNGDDMNKVKKQVQRIKAMPAKPIELLPAIKPIEQAAYQAHSLSSPFTVPKNASKQTSGQKPPLYLRQKLNQKKQPLETFPLDSLKMVGAIKLNKQTWALVQVPNGNIYPVTMGEYLGQNYGEITEITDNEIKIMEKVQANGQWKSHVTGLKLSH